MTAGVPAPAKQDRRTVVVGTRRPAQSRRCRFQRRRAPRLRRASIRMTHDRARGGRTSVPCARRNRSFRRTPAAQRTRRCMQGGPFATRRRHGCEAARRRALQSRPRRPGAMGKNSNRSGRRRAWSCSLLWSRARQAMAMPLPYPIPTPETVASGRVPIRQPYRVAEPGTAGSIGVDRWVGDHSGGRVQALPGSHDQLSWPVVLRGPAARSRSRRP